MEPRDVTDDARNVDLRNGVVSHHGVVSETCDMPSCVAVEDVSAAGEDVHNFSGHHNATKASGRADVRRRVYGVLYASSLLSDILLNMEMYGKRRRYPERTRGDRYLRDVIQFYYRCSDMIKGSVLGMGGCPVQFFTKKHRRCSGWRMTWKGVQNNTCLSPS